MDPTLKISFKYFLKVNDRGCSVFFPCISEDIQQAMNELANAVNEASENKKESFVAPAFKGLIPTAPIVEGDFQIISSVAKLKDRGSLERFMIVPSKSTAITQMREKEIIERPDKKLEVFAVRDEESRQLVDFGNQGQLFTSIESIKNILDMLAKESVNVGKEDHVKKVMSGWTIVVLKETSTVRIQP